MNIEAKAGLIFSISDIQLFPVIVSDKNYIKVRKKLEMEREKALEILRNLKKEGIIKSVSLPRNRDIQESLDRIVDFKEIMKNNIDKIKEVFYK